MKQAHRLIVGISGASGICYGVEALRMLQPLPVETHLIISKSAELTLHHETDLKLDDVQALADVYHPVKNIGASVASGSFQTMGMLIAPCSIRSMSEILSGTTSTLLTRAADVVLKERRKLVLMVRETPLHAGHLRTMASLSDLGAIIAPPVPAFYTRPSSIEDVVRQSVSRALELFDIEKLPVQRWEG